MQTREVVPAYLGSSESSDRLLRALAEQLKSPLLYIARQAELANTQPNQILSDIEYKAAQALQFIDSYLLSVQLQDLPQLELEPVSVSALLHDTVHQLLPMAKQYSCHLELSVQGRYGPVMAHRASLVAALNSLAQVFVTATPSGDTQHRVVLAVRKNTKGLSMGIFGNQANFGADVFRRAKALYGRAPQAVPSLSSQSGVGIFIADSLLSAMAAPLQISRYQKLSGLSATLLPSQQLSLV